MGCISCGNEEIIINYDIKTDALSQHCKYRKNHKVGNLTLSEELCDKANKKISKLIEKDDDEYIDDEDEGELGENLYISYQGPNKVKEICESWYNEKKNYIFGQIKYQKGTGHFTQMIWKGTKEVGFGWGTSKSNKFYFLAYYYPAGNEIGKFKENVLEDKSKKNAKEE